MEDRKEGILKKRGIEKGWEGENFKNCSEKEEITTMGK